MLKTHALGHGYGFRDVPHDAITKFSLSMKGGDNQGFEKIELPLGWSTHTVAKGVSEQRLGKQTGCEKSRNLLHVMHRSMVGR
jgi:hypothetical protein